MQYYIVPIMGDVITNLFNTLILHHTLDRNNVPERVGTVHGISEFIIQFKPHGISGSFI